MGSTAADEYRQFVTRRITELGYYDDKVSRGSELNKYEQTQHSHLKEWKRMYDLEQNKNNLTEAEREELQTLTNKLVNGYDTDSGGGGGYRKRKLMKSKKSKKYKKSKRYKKITRRRQR